MKPTVLVIGGGATGVGVVRDLAMRGVDAMLVERSGLSGGTSGRSHGLLHSGARYAEADPEGAVECIEENRILKRIAGAAIRDSGGYFLQLAGDDPDYFDAKRRACRDHGIEAEAVDVDELRVEVPDLADEVVRAMRVPDGVIYPSRLLAANAASARDHGATIHPHTSVTDLHVEDGELVGATVDGEIEGRIDADYVVNATGAWAGKVAALAGVEVQMRPTRGVMVAVDYPELGPALNRCRAPDDGDIVVPHDEQVVLGTTSVVVDDPDDYEEESWEIDRTVEQCASMLPAVADREVERVYWGVRPLYAPDEDAREERGISRDFVLLDHGDDGVGAFATIVGGKLTTYRRMAEATADHVCEMLGVDEPCRTADERLPGADDPDELDALVREFDARSPADEDVVGVGDVDVDGGRSGVDAGD